MAKVGKSYHPETLENQCIKKIAYNPFLYDFREIHPIFRAKLLVNINENYCGGRHSNFRLYTRGILGFQYGIMPEQESALRTYTGPSGPREDIKTLNILGYGLKADPKNVDS
jgi:hypothetical protein